MVAQKAVGERPMLNGSGDGKVSQRGLERSKYFVTCHSAPAASISLSFSVQSHVNSIADHDY